METDLFAERLNEAIDGLGVTNAALARMIGVNQYSVKGWRTGRNMPDGYNVAKLCKALNVSADWLLGLEATGDDEA